MPRRKKKNFQQGKNLCTFKLTSDGSVVFKDEESHKIAVKLNIIPGEDEEIANSHLMDAESRRRVQEKYNIFAGDDDNYNYLQHLRRRRKEPEEEEAENSNDILRRNPDALLHVITGKKVTSVAMPMDAQNEKEMNDDLKEVLAALENEKEMDGGEEEDDDDDDNFFNNLLKSPPMAEKNSGSQRKAHLVDVNDDFGITEDINEEEEEFDDEFDSDTCEQGYSGNSSSAASPHKMTSHGNPDSLDSTISPISSVEHQYRNLRLDDKPKKEMEKIWSKAFDDLDDDLSDDFEEDMTKDMETARQAVEEDEERNQTVLMKDFIEQPMDKDKILDRFAYESNSSDEEMIEIVKTVDPLEGFDCESIISSRATNRTFTPKVIEILPMKSKRKSNTKGERSEEDIASQNGSINLGCQKKMTKIYDKDPELEMEKPATIPRCKNETLEEKRARKTAVKEHQKERREAKAERKKLFSQEIQKRKEENGKTVQMRTSTRIE